MLVLRPSSLVSLTCAIRPRKLKTGELFCLKLKAMASKAHLSDLPTPASKSPGCRKKGSIEPKGQSKKASDKVDVKENSVEIEDIRRDPNRLNTLTVKELQAMTRTVGISSRDSKKELVSALKRFCSNTENDGAVEHVDPESVPSKRKVKSSSLEDHTKDSSTLSDISITKRRRSRIKKELVECMAVEDDSLTVVKQKKCSSNVEEVLEEKNSRSNKSASKQTQCVEVVACQTNLPLVSAEPWTMLAHKKPQKDWIPYNPTTMRLPPLSRDTNFLKLMSWNVNGLRALLKLESFSALQLAQKEDFDVICLQETKIQEKDVEEIKERLISGYDHSFWTCSVSKLGYSGTAIISRVKPISVRYGLGISDHDSEGRLVTMEFDTFFLLCGYVPNSGDGLRRLTYRVEEWDRSLSDYMKELEKLKPVVLTGDLNCAHQEIDIFNPAGNRRSAGFTIEERESFEKNFLSRGFVDTFRKQHPGVVAYTYWGYRHGGRKANKGWRLDYFLVSESIAEKVYDSYILPQVGGSDHCPIGLILKL